MCFKEVDLIDKYALCRFMRRCRDATTNDTKAKHYIDILMSSVEYDTFVKLMRLMRPVAAHRMNAEDKGVEDKEFTSPSKAAKDADDRHHGHHDEDFSRADSKTTHDFEDDKPEKMNK